MKKKQLNIIASVLFAIGIVNALLFFYYYTDESNTDKAMLSIDKTKALGITLESGRWDETSLQDKKTDLTLLHTKNDGFTFVVDEDTLEDKSVFFTKLADIKEDKYVWFVQISMEGGSNKIWNYLIDAQTGELLNQKQDLAQVQPLDPNAALKDNVTIKQAQGNVTVVFPNGISQDVQKSSPFPAQLIITRADTVTWVNNDVVAHTITSGYPEQPDYAGQMFDSGLISPQDSFSYTFTDQRIDGYSYFCSVHPWMRGQIVVIEKN